MYKNMVRMEDELAERVKAKAKEEKRSMNNMLCHALEVYLKGCECVEVKNNKNK